jgi:hypothetical protein
MTNDELKEQFAKCEGWQDAEQWDLLAMAYFWRGYVLNAGLCFKRADAIRAKYQPVKLDAVCIELAAGAETVPA